MGLLLLLTLVASSAPDGGSGRITAPPLDRCATAADCALRDGRCLKADAGGVPSPECRCANDWCARRPSPPPAPAGACSGKNDCSVDLSAGVCLAAPDRGYSWPMRDQGSSCTCQDGGCAFEWFEPVPCKTFKDCSYAREPVLHPTSSTKVKRTHPGPVRPCKDSETDSVCDPKTKTCRVVHWSC